jgi:hypothetical protein
MIRQKSALTIAIIFMPINEIRPPVSATASLLPVIW